MNHSTQTQRATARHQVQAAIGTLGWTAIDSTALAMKVFGTAVGDKVAHIYLKDFGPESVSFMLEGDYRSEGRNILESQCMLLPKGADAAKTLEVVTAFVQRVEKAVGQSYAVRLLAPTAAA